MPTLNGRNYTGVPGLNIRANNGTIRFETPTITPTVTSGERLLYVNSSNELIFQNGTSSTTIGAAGTGTPTWETLFAADATFTMTPNNTFTIAGNRATATDVVTITNIAGGSGSCLQITNSGSGNDVDGTSNTWGVTALGVATFTGLTLSGANTITSTAGDITWTLEDNDATALSIGSSGDTDMLVFNTDNTTPTVIFNDAMQVTDGNATFISTSNTATNILVTNNTLTTFGANANSAGAVCLRSTSLTTGSLLQLQLSDTANAGGFYLNCRESVGGTNDFTIGENGVVVALGTAGSNSFTLSNGDVLMSDGSLTITDADNAATLSVTNDNATTASVFVFAGSGAFTGTTTTSFMTLTPSGLTTGTALYIACGAATTLSHGIDLTSSHTTGKGMTITCSGIMTGVGMALEIVADSATTAGNAAGEGVVTISADGLTTGTALNVESLSNELMTSGNLADFAHTAVGTTVAAKTGSVFRVTSSMTESGTSTQDYDVMALTRTSIHNTAGTLTAQGSVLRLEVVSTETAATLTDTVAGLEIVLAALSGGDAINITHSGTTTGQALVVTASQTSVDGVLNLTGNSVDSGRFIVADVNGLTTGIGLEVTHTTSVITTGSVCRITSTGVDTGTGQGTLLDLVSSGAQAATVVSLVADALTSGIGFLASFDGLTTGEGVSLTHTTSVIADGGSLFRLSSTGIDTGGATNGALLDMSSTAQAAGIVAKLTANGLTTGTALQVTSSGTITSAGEGLVNIVATGMTTGDALKIDLTEGTLTTGNYINCYDDTGATSVFRVAEDGIVTILGADGSASLTISNGDLVISDGAMASAVESVTCGVGAATFAVDSNVVRVTGDGGGNTITTITGGVAGQIVTLIFEDALVTINDDNTHGADSIDLVGANTTFADDATLTLVYAAGSWYEVARSIND